MAAWAFGPGTQLDDSDVVFPGQVLRVRSAAKRATYAEAMERHIKTGGDLRLFLAVSTGLLWVILVIDIVLMVVGVVRPDPMGIALGLLVAAILTVQTIVVWRATVIVHDDGITVHPGLGGARHARWPDVTRVRPARFPRPAAIELRDGADIVFGGWSPFNPPLTRGQFRELEDAIEARS